MLLWGPISHLDLRDSQLHLWVINLKDLLGSCVSFCSFSVGIWYIQGTFLFYPLSADDSTHPSQYYRYQLADNMSCFFLLFMYFPPTVPMAPELQLETLNCTTVGVRWHLPAGSATDVQGYKLSYHEESQPEGPSTQIPPHQRQHTIGGLGEYTKPTQ